MAKRNWRVKILRGLATRLESLTNYLYQKAEEPKPPEVEPSPDNLPERDFEQMSPAEQEDWLARQFAPKAPPADWLAKVSKAAPHLLQGSRVGGQEAEKSFTTETQRHREVLNQNPPEQTNSDTLPVVETSRENSLPSQRGGLGWGGMPKPPKTQDEQVDTNHPSYSCKVIQDEETGVTKPRPTPEILPDVKTSRPLPSLPQGENSLRVGVKEGSRSNPDSAPKPKKPKRPNLVEVAKAIPLKQNKAEVTNQESATSSQRSAEGTASDRQPENGQKVGLQPVKTAKLEKLEKLKEVKEANRPSNFNPQTEAEFKGWQLRAVETTNSSVSGNAVRPLVQSVTLPSSKKFLRAVETNEADRIELERTPLEELEQANPPFVTETTFTTESEPLNLKQWADLPDKMSYLPPPPDFGAALREWQHLQELEREQRGL
jgi:hypothetical protein